MESLTVNAVTGGYDFHQIPSCNFDGGYFTCWKPNKISEKTANDRGVSNDEQVILLAFELDDGWLQTDCI
jgi:hypothetical protein